MLPILISTPHSSAAVPAEIFSSMLETGENKILLQNRILYEGDPLTDQIFSIPDVLTTINAEYSRFVVDLNRERNEMGENGVIKLTDFNRNPFYAPSYQLTVVERERRLKLYYDPYHDNLEKYFSENRFDFFIDGHSMTAMGPAIGPDQENPRPAICIGNFGDERGEKNGSELSCSPAQARFIQGKLDELLSDFLREEKLPTEIALNRPFEGGYILKKYSAAPFSVPGILLEINRALYWDEVKVAPIPGRIAVINAAIRELVRGL